MHISEEEYQKIIQQHLNPSENNFSANHKADEGSEAKLVARAAEWCRERAYPYIVNPSTKRLSWYIQAGMPDMVVFLPHGITALFEFKVKRGRLSDKQKLTHSMLNYIGHSVYLVRSFKAFLQTVTKLLTKE